MAREIDFRSRGVGCQAGISARKSPFGRFALGAFAAVASLQLVGCTASGGDKDVDASLADAAVTIDARPVDGSTVDGSTVDGSTVDGSTVDGSTVDGSTVDGSTVDGSTVDGSTVDGSTVDGSTVDGSTVDGSAGGCTQVATWTALQTSALYSATEQANYVDLANGTTAPFDVFSFETWHLDPYPKTETYTSASTYTDCDICLAVRERCNAIGASLGCTGADFFAQGGSATVEQADESASSGRFRGSATNLRLVEWDFPNDEAIVGGRCYEIGSVTADVTWPPGPTPDGGVVTPDGGTTPDGGVNAGSIFFTGDYKTDNTGQVGRFDTAVGMSTGLPNTGKVFYSSDQADAPGTFALSSDGQKVYFGYDPAGGSSADLYVMNRDGSGLTQLLDVPPTAAVEQIRLSPDGTKVAIMADYDAATDNAPNAYIVSSTTLTATPLRAGPAAPMNGLEVTDIAWSRDSRYLAIAGDFTTNGIYELHIYDTMTSTSVPAVTGANITASGPVLGARKIQWAAGNRLLFSGFVTSTTQQIYTVSATGTGLAPLANSVMRSGVAASVDTYFAISPDGTKVAFAADGSIQYNYELYTALTDSTGTSTALTSGVTGGTMMAERGPTRIAWSPDGTKLAYLSDAALDGKNEPYVVSATGGTPTRVARVGMPTDIETDAVDICWAPDSAQLGFAADSGTNNVFQLYKVANTTTADQTPTLLQSAVSGGDINNCRWVQ